MRIEFKNFRCLRDTSLDLTPLTVIVGPNASGKSSILAALNPVMPLSVADRWQRRPNLEVTIRRRLPGGVEFLSRLSAGQEVSRVRSNSDHGYDSYQLLRLDVQALRRPNSLVAHQVLQQDGGNITNVFDTLDRQSQSALVKQFCSVVPVFGDVNAKPLASGPEGHKQLTFKDRWNPEAEYLPGQVSDGSFLVLAFLILQHQSPAPNILAIEELERGLHPYLIKELVEFLRKMAMGGFGGSQMHIVIATHSPEVLEFAEPEEARFLTRAEDGSVQIESLPVGEKNWRQAFENYKHSLGSAWLAGAVGGVPSP